MSNAKHPRSRTTDLIRITREYFEDTGNSELWFSKILWTIYLDIVPESQRRLDIHPWAGPLDKYSERIINKQYTRFLRYMDGTVNLPMEVEESWVEALEEPYRTRAVQVLCGRYNVVAVDQTPMLDTKRASLCLQEYARFLEQTGKMLADGKIDANDKPHLEELEEAVTGLVAQVQALLSTARIKTAAGDTDDEIYPETVGRG